jgi:hypothetical protein
MSDLTPIDVERRLTQLVTQITNAQNELRTARDAETEAGISLKRARLYAGHRDDCPKVVRGGSTVAERDEWIDRLTFDEWSAAKRAETSREIAQDSLRAVLAVAEVVRSLGSSVRTAYSLAGAAS